jgi:hypothetical protein
MAGMTDCWETKKLAVKKQTKEFSKQSYNDDKI